MKNFLELNKAWFDRDLSQFNLYLMPVGFVMAPGAAVGIGLASDKQQLIDYLTRIVKDHSQSIGGFYVALEVNLSLKRVSTGATAQVKVTRDPNAPKVQLTEEDIRQQYPWGYHELTQRLKSRYIDFKINQKYHYIRKPLKSDPRYVRVRYLDSENPKSSKKDYYNPNIVNEFDKHYTRK